MTMKDTASGLQSWNYAWNIRAWQQWLPPQSPTFCSGEGVHERVGFGKAHGLAHSWHLISHTGRRCRGPWKTTNGSHKVLLFHYLKCKQTGMSQSHVFLRQLYLQHMPHWACPTHAWESKRRNFHGKNTFFCWYMPCSDFHQHSLDIHSLYLFLPGSEYSSWIYYLLTLCGWRHFKLTVPLSCTIYAFLMPKERYLLKRQTICITLKINISSFLVNSSKSEKDNESWKCKKWPI